MRCRHTVPDWHRYVVPGAEAPPIFSACRLLIREGERTSDPRSIACSYWGHQPDCPVYDGPLVQVEVLPRRRPQPVSRQASRDVPLGDEAAWPVRPPGADDGMRRLVICLGLLSVGLLTWTALVGLAMIRGTAWSSHFLSVTLVVAVVSVVTHVLATLRIWGRR
jgi:hypothetical protein